ncbi:hypothetical protein CA13_68830 [Planctomycetes bacterium CA13]|uniref:Glutamine amidotransferase domain-containing protein n=1 Tax=Novipirellula herctigrandis TaxID=2527986 RepID=A0A5C5YNF8_9BACT|nr:hypothetical protein CA13_68830 [Planctomycetes bacterium CA13]
MTMAVTGIAGLIAQEIYWGSPDWVWPIVVVVTLLALLTIWNYWRNRASGVFGLIAAVLKLAAIGLIAICLLEPMRSGTRPQPKANILPILVDTSRSMTLKTDDASESRSERAARRLDPKSSWRIRLAQDFDVRDYAFDDSLKPIDLEQKDLTPDGYTSSLATSLGAVKERFLSRPVGGVLLFTDGNLTDAPSADFDWSTLGFPVYPVLNSQKETLRDVAITGTSIRQTDFESAPMTVRVQVTRAEIPDEPLFVQLRDAISGNLVEEQSLAASEDGRPQEVTFQFRPEKSGVSFYRAIVFREVDRESMEMAGDKDPSAGSSEATLVNNQRIITVDRKSGPYRILYVAGRPNWEFKFLRRSLAEDAEIQLVGLIRIANKEPKFSFRDQGVTSSNPLFQGLGEDEEEIAEQYDEPVMIRLGVKESEELSDGFPDSAEELFSYQAVILDDIEPSFFSQDQLLLLRRFVGSRGGGFMMLGGQESFDGKAFADSPLGELSAVYAARRDKPSRAGEYRLQISREGMLEPWIRLRDNEASEQNRLRKMPFFTTLNAVGDVKPGASSILSVETRDGQTMPGLVTQRFGKGRTAAMPIGDLWRWSMRRGEKDAGDNNREDPAQMWRQIAHWLVGEVPRRVDATVEPSDDVNAPAKIVVTVRDEAYLPLDNAIVELKITPSGGEPFTLLATADDRSAGVYSSEYWTRETGGCLVDVTTLAPDGSHVGTAQTGFSSQVVTSEFSDLSLNRKLLTKIADQTGGEVIDDSELSAFASDLPNRRMPISETWVYPLWHRTWVMITAIACLCGEWGIRRWKGLA